ncbi:MAG: glutathione S-transferase N-terminal domain-containing protein [Alphaproteobacteria bacterium]|jgi:glutathione S-transferase|nr:glutathione S-transferase [Rhodospirillaceae bacterium]MDP6404413.1 glutathione S-transferase N-terminal domain-containing protein [Alphaproteobacteria bacterium]MDP6623755.1 glutathione S-transferase N-terminal domain-containing protein [Alphaproteobacteria bacterium]|tara:strand:+ start:1149 stop:1757 length:609 start_codon:yes stop_codon:yes gene_type:complete
MRLHYSPASPYVRKVLATAIELGLDGGIALVPTQVWDPDSDLPSVNPLGKVPALELDDGGVLYDSPVICEFLAAQVAQPALYPPPGPARWTMLRRAALADGILDAAVGRVVEERRRPQEFCYQGWCERLSAAVERALDVFEAEMAELPALDYATLTLAVALGYLDFRFAERDWRPGRPALAAWNADFSGRPSLVRTQPKEAG